MISSTVTRHSADLLPAVAVIVALPTFSALILPMSDTETVVESLLVQVTLTPFGLVIAFKVCSAPTTSVVLFLLKIIVTLSLLELLLLQPDNINEKQDNAANTNFGKLDVFFIFCSLVDFKYICIYFVSPFNTINYIQKDIKKILQVF